MPTQDQALDPNVPFLPSAIPEVGNTVPIEDYRPGQGSSEADTPDSPYAIYVPEAADFPRSAFYLRYSVMTLPEYCEHYVSNLPLRKRRRLRLKRGVEKGFPVDSDLQSWRGFLGRIGGTFGRMAAKAQELAGEAGPRLRDEWDRFADAMLSADAQRRPEDPGRRLHGLFQDLERAAHSVRAEKLIGEFEALAREIAATMRDTARRHGKQERLTGRELAPQRSRDTALLRGRLERLYADANISLPPELDQLSIVAGRKEVLAVYNKALEALMLRVKRDISRNPELEQQFDRQPESERSPFFELLRAERDAERDAALEHHSDPLPERNLSAFFEVVRLLEEKKQVVDQAILIIEQVYAHLPYKRARYAIDPVQRLRLLRSRLDAPVDGASEDGSESDATLTEGQFHEEMFEIFKSLRDPHTYYQLPPIYDDLKAFVPFQMAAYSQAGSRRFVVTQIAEWFCGSHAAFRRGAEITHWNGLPIEEAVMQNGEREGGNSIAARFARGLLKMTVRTLRFGMPPKEEWVHLRYLAADNGEPREMILPWLFWTLRGVNIFDTLAELEKSLAARAAPEGLRTSLSGDSCEPADGRKLSVSPDVTETNRSRMSGSKDRRREEIEHLRSLMLADKFNPFDPASTLSTQDIKAAWKIAFDPQSESYLPDVFEFRLLKEDPSVGALLPPVPTLHSPQRLAGRDPFSLDTGYVRIRTFSFSPHQEFVDEFRRILRIMETHAPDGLIIDVRGNGGGIIRNGERILQLISPRKIVPEKFHFLASPLTRKVAEELSREPNPAVQAADTGRAARTFDIQTRRGAMETVVSGEWLVRSGQFLTSEQQANDVGQEYHGPVALIIDALSYSTTDMFAAGFQDHEIGAIIGVDANTGGGGANVWNYERDLVPILAPVTGDIKPTPDGTRMGVSARRCYRSGKNAGLAIEDVGVRADAIHVLTREDLVPSDDHGPDHENRNYRDLLSFAIKHLAAAERVRLEVTPGDWRAAREGSARPLGVSFRAENIDRLEFYVNGVPQCTVTPGRGSDGDSAEATGSLEIPAEGIDLTAADSIVLEVRGYRREGREPVATVRKTDTRTD